MLTFQRVLLWFALGVLAITIILELYYWIFVGCVRSSTRDELGKIENLKPFPQALSGKDLEFWVDEET